MFEDIPRSLIYTNKKGGEDYLKAPQLRAGLINYSSSLQGNSVHLFKVRRGKVLRGMRQGPRHIKWGGGRGFQIALMAISFLKLKRKQKGGNEKSIQKMFLKMHVYSSFFNQVVGFLPFFSNFLQ